MADAWAANPIAAGLKGRCPRCGEGYLFSGFLKIADHCEACGLDFRGEDVGDGPVAFIVLIVGVLVVIPALIVEVAYGWPIWLHMLVWLPLTLFGCLALMRPLRGLSFALQYKNRAAEARLHDERRDDGPS